MTNTRDERLEIDGLSLATYGWEALDISDLYSSANYRGADSFVPFLDGQIARRRWIDAKRVSIQMIVHGNVDENGVAYASSLTGLRTNLDTLYKKVRPRQNSGSGTVLLRHHLDDGTIREADAIPVGFQVGWEGPHHAKGTIDLLIPGGVLKDTTDTIAGPTAFSAAGDLTVSNPGNTDQFDMTIDLSGTATSVKLISRTWDATDETWLNYGGAVSGGIEIDTKNFTVLEGTTSRIGNFTHSGHERWLPLLPGNNTIRVQPTGGNVTVTVTHRAKHL